ncbi:MAG: hydrolase 1, exosortase A system-associated [Candidatus Andeanibacterium colombiense]|uniref:Hydrolase 1, exosortase A system-associated n=1 Tax=Candidatus Andeanibacterium colombiense TaxID=3121345 RepID=A0AAJ6BMX4_9SPHN|nr:MAG: hydrolase 1, exosortase A system-associated [Sphingomonadaceae bacterium]
MSRRHLSFACQGARLAATLDEAPGTTGLLIVTGGNETRAGAFGGQAELAARIAATGFPVFRFDRRGVGDSEGENTGFRHSAPDISAALAAFRREAPQLTRIAGFGNCDAASALMLSAGAGLDALALANPWTIEGAHTAPPPAALRARYSAKLHNPKELWRLLTGGVSLRKLAGGIRHALRPAPAPSGLAEEVAAGLARFAGNSTILLAGRDRTAQVFAANWDAADPRLRHCTGASHAFAEAEAREWLFGELIPILEGLASG